MLVIAALPAFGLKVGETSVVAFSRPARPGLPTTPWSWEASPAACSHPWRCSSSPGWVQYDRTGSTNAAAVDGLGRTGRLVTCAALILFLAFMSLASAPDTDVKVLATGLGAGIVLDATLVRGFLVPALVALLRRRNWWAPQPLRRAQLLRPEPKEIALADADR